MGHTKQRYVAVLLTLGIGCSTALIGTAAAESGNWPVPPQDNLAGCAGHGAGDDVGAPLEILVSDRYGPYRGDQVVMVSDMNGVPVVTLACDGPVDQIRLRPGTYRVQAFIADAARSDEILVNVPPSGTSVALLMTDEPNQSFNTPNID